MFIREKNKPRLQLKKKKKNNIPKECRRNKIIIKESNERKEKLQRSIKSNTILKVNIMFIIIN